MASANINDVRTEAQLRNPTFSKYQRSAVKKELLSGLQRGHIEACCYWSAELVCSGLLMDLWDVILHYASKHIHTGNPKLPVYLSMRFASFKEIMTTGYGGNDLGARNNERVRRLFAEIACILCLSQKSHAFETVKVGKSDFDVIHMNDKLKAPSVEYIQQEFLSGDPKEVFIPLNEFAYCISDARNSVMGCYWVEWILEFESLCKKQKERCEGRFRTFPSVHEKYQKDVIWIVWEVILRRSGALGAEIQKIVESLLDLYCISYTPGVKRKRRYIVYHAVSACCDTIPSGTALVSNKSLVQQVVENCHMVYKDLKKNEEAPSTDYLFNHNTGEKSNSEKTMDRLERLEKLESWNTVIPEAGPD